MTLTKDAILTKGEGWYLDNKGCLHIFGAVTTDYISYEVCTPWDIYKDQITSVVTEPGASIDNCENMFKDCVHLTSANLRYLDTSRAYSMTRMFYGCSKLTHVDVSNFNTKNVDYMREMFAGCVYLYELDLSSFEAGNDVDGVMDDMFRQCSRLFRLKIGNFAPTIAYTDNMLRGCISLSEVQMNNRILWGFDSFGVTTADQLISISPVWIDNNGTVYTDANEIIASSPTKLTRGNLDEPEKPSNLGDVNGDGEVDELDSAIVARYSAGMTDLTSEQQAVADVNDDGEVDELDSALISRYSAGMISQF